MLATSILATYHRKQKCSCSSTSQERNCLRHWPLVPQNKSNSIPTDVMTKENIPQASVTSKLPFSCISLPIPQVQKIIRSVNWMSWTMVHEVNELDQFTLDITWNQQNNGRRFLLRFYFIIIECFKEISASHCVDFHELIQDANANKFANYCPTMASKKNQIRTIELQRIIQHKHVKRIPLQESP